MGFILEVVLNRRRLPKFIKSKRSTLFEDQPGFLLFWRTYERYVFCFFSMKTSILAFGLIGRLHANCRWHAGVSFVFNPMPAASGLLAGNRGREAVDQPHMSTGNPER
jgi:hypothetical protein